MKSISALLLLFTVSTAALAQVEEARRAMDRGDNVQAVNILSDALANNPNADIYLELGTAPGGMLGTIEGLDQIGKRLSLVFLDKKVADTAIR